MKKVKLMGKVSYKFTIPLLKYEEFRREIDEICARYQIADLVEFKDQKSAAVFNCDASDLFFFEKCLGKNAASKYPFFCDLSSKNPNCQRFEDGQLISYEQAYQKEIEHFQALKTKNPLDLGSITSQDFANLSKQGHSIVIGEYHPDPLPKEFLLDLMSSWQDRAEKTIIAIERLPSSQNDSLRAWLKDGRSDTKIPPYIAELCNFVDRQNASLLWEKAGKLPKITELLYSAKTNGFDVVFFESEQSRCGSVDKKENHRHECLISSMKKLRSQHSSRSFVVLAGAYHDDRQQVSLSISEAIGAISCLMMSESLAEEFEKRAAQSRSPEIAEEWLLMKSMIEKAAHKNLHDKIMTNLDAELGISPKSIPSKPSVTRTAQQSQTSTIKTHEKNRL